MLLAVLATMVPILAHATAPVVTTTAATSVLATTATVNGTVDPTNRANTVTFQYGTTTAYTGVGSPVHAAPYTIASGGPVTPVSAALTGLTCNTTYHYRVVSNNSDNVTVNGGDLTFTTTACAPTATTGSFSVGATTATVNGTVASNGASTTVTFQYGLSDTTPSYGSTVNATQSPVAAVSGSANSTGVSAAVTGLTCNTTYHFRVVASGFGTINGGDVSFTTAACAPTATTNAASSVAAITATVNGTVASKGASTTVTFEYGLTTGYGSTATASPSPVGAVLGSDNSTPVSAALTVLTCNTTYHFRVVAAGSGTTNGLDGTFTTTACAPTATTNAASSVAATTATVNGIVESRGASTTVTFQYGLTTGYGSTATAVQSPVAAVSGNPNSTGVSAALTGLTCGVTRYYYRVVAVNSVGTANGFDGTFTTSGCFAAPTATTNAASSVAANTATFNGTVSSNGASTTVTFGYGLASGAADTYTFSATAAQSALPGGASGTAVSYAASGLSCNTTYYFRVKGVNSYGTTNGLEGTFTTTACAPTATTYPASSVAATTATVNGTVESRGASTTVTFQYGLNTGYGSTATAVQSPVAAVSGNPNSTGVSAALTGLTCGGTPYHYRVVAVNSVGTTNGGDQTFTTTACITTVTGISPSSGPPAGGTSVTITGTNFTGVNAVKFGSTNATSYAFVSATQITATAPAGSAGTVHVTVTTPTGTSATSAADQFTYIAPPNVTTNAASGITSWVATLNGTVSANGAATTVYFEYGLTNLYGSSITAEQSPLVASAPANAPVKVDLIGLNCASTFHYRAVAVNSGGLVNGADVTFTTGVCTASYPPDACAATRFGEDLGCTANDVLLSNIAVAAGSPSYCISGTPVTLNIDMTVNFGSSSRYDIGIFIANDGKSPTVLPTSGGASTCKVDVLPTDPLESFPNLDGAGTYDTCGDGSAGLSKIHHMTGVTIPCYASPSSGGKLYVPYVVSWDNQASPIGSFCGALPYPKKANQYPVPNTKSKCNAPVSDVSIDVVVLPKINKTHSGATFNGGDSITYSIVVFNDSGGTLQQSTLTDPAVPGLINVSSTVGCATANGSTCPNTSKALIQGSGIVISSANLPNNSSLTFTVTGTLSGQTGDIINNTATITIGSSNRSSTDSVQLGSASGAMSFSPSSITEGNNSVLTITFTNPTASGVGVGFWDSGTLTYADIYPSGLVNAAVPNPGTTCGGSIAATAGGNTLTFSGGTIPPLGTCTVSVTVTSATANSYVNSVAFSGISGSTSATLSVTTAVFGRFNACNSATAPNAGCISATSPTTSRLGTKLAGTAFNLDLVALNSNGSRNTSYANTVVVELLDASNNTGTVDAYNCRSTWTTVIATLSSNPAFISGNTGLKTVGPFIFTVANAYKDVRVRITQSGSTTIKGCSTDNFAIRPTGFTLSSTNAYYDNSGTSTSATPIKAGASFSLTATAVAVATTAAAYVGTPLINGSGITAHTGAVQTGNLTGTFGAAASGIATGSPFTYSEVGYLGFNPDAIYDDTFTAVDMPSDCTNDFSNTAVYGLFGCKFGNTATIYFGRFIPDHFTTTVTQGCSGGNFTYSEQPMTVAVTAYNGLSVPTVTRNYDGIATPVFAKDVTLSAWDAASGTGENPGSGAVTPVQPPAIMLKTAFVQGVGTVSTPVYTFGAKLTAPTSIRLRGIDGDTVSVSSNGFTEGTTEIRSGRLRLSNIFGSEKSPLTMAVQAQYWSGQSWVLNSADGSGSYTCSALPANAFALFGTGTLAGIINASAVTLSGGSGTLTLTQMGSSPTTGSVSVAADLGATGSGSDQSCLVSHGGIPANLPWLRSQNGNCAATYDRDPSATATFGIYSPEIKKTVHVRELY